MWPLGRSCRGYQWRSPVNWFSPVQKPKIHVLLKPQINAKQHSRVHVSLILSICSKNKLQHVVVWIRYIPVDRAWLLDNKFFCLNFMNESLKKLFYCFFEVIVSFVIHERRVFMIEYWKKKYRMKQVNAFVFILYWQGCSLIINSEWCEISESPDCNANSVLERTRQLVLKCLWWRQSASETANEPWWWEQGIL